MDAILKRRLKVVPRTDEPVEVNHNKTLAMRLLENQFGQTIEYLLDEEQGSLKEVAKTLGIDESTVSKWRLRLGMRT
ncbi:hypothetical protein LCGC14_1321120 [marine sediment metagenome]|uniref:Uncharacterized protein n=1 Tax=marine sediment metagenome TaxID=412755 RepID=A0A0F9L4X9_9ZZZZ